MNWEEFKMSLITDLQNMFIGIAEKDKNVLVDFLANGDITDLSENACRDILHLDCINNDFKIKFTVCKFMIRNNCHIDLAVNEFTTTISTYPTVMESIDIYSMVNDIINDLLRIRLSDNALLNLIDCLEMLYAYGFDQYSTQIVSLYNQINSNVKSLQYKPEIIRAKLAIFSYGANKYNVSENYNKMYELYQYIKKSKIKGMKGVIYYYHGIFYRRTKFQKTYLNLKNGYSYMPFSDALFTKSKSFGFWLADIII